MKKLMIAAAALVLATTGPLTASEADGTISIEINAGGYTEADVTDAISIFRSNCLPLGGEFWGDVTEVRAVVHEEHAPYRLAQGFKNTLTLRIKYADDPRYGPVSGTGVGMIAGHWLTYDLGGGPTPGYFADKKASQYLCGLSFSPKGDSLFINVPELSILDQD